MLTLTKTVSGSPSLLSKKTVNNTINNDNKKIKKEFQQFPITHFLCVTCKKNFFFLLKSMSDHSTFIILSHFL
jgi:hypothetical protein